MVKWLTAGFGDGVEFGLLFVLHFAGFALLFHFFAVGFFAVFFPVFGGFFDFGFALVHVGMHGLDAGEREGHEGGAEKELFFHMFWLLCWIRGG